MKLTNQCTLFSILFFSGVFLTHNVFAEPTPVATYIFDNSFNALEENVVAITPVDPLNENSFMVDSVFEEERVVYRFDGNTAVDEGAGLLLVSRSILEESNTYSVELVFQFEMSESNSYKNIFGVSNRQKDNAFYVSPSNRLKVFPGLSGTDEFAFESYHHVILTNDGNGKVSVYLNGALQFKNDSTSMDFIDNPERLIHFFVDDQTEVSDGRVALIKIYDTELSLEEVQELNENPLGRCMASYTSEGILTIPCVKVTDTFGTVSIYEAQLQITSSSPPSFQLKSAQQINLSQATDNGCTANYTDTRLSLPCLNVLDIFGGGTSYHADLELILNSNPLTFKLIQADRKD